MDDKHPEEQADGDESLTDPDPEQQDPESGAAADEGGDTPSQAEG